MTQASIIKNYLYQCNGWVPSYDLIKRETNWGFLGSGADRAARELAINGLIDRARGKEIGKDKRFVYYRYKEKLVIEPTPSRQGNFYHKIWKEVI